MGGISVGGGHGGKKSVDSEIPLVPFIDLLLCCVMFLLVTAVWNELASVSVSQRVPGIISADEIADEKLKILLLITARSYELSTSAGDRIVIPASGEAHDLATLRTKLSAYHDAHPSLADISVTAEDGVEYASLIAALDAARAEGFKSIAL